MISSLTLCIGYIMVGFTERKQGLHDMIAGTLVPGGREVGFHTRTHCISGVNL